MKKCTKSRPPVSPVVGAPQRRTPSQAQEVQSLREGLREVLVGEIREAVRRTATQLVEDEVHELVDATGPSPTALELALVGAREIG